MSDFRFDADELLREELVLTKIDVAERQLNAAIRMFFHQVDPVAFHTVTAACHGVLYDLASSNGIKKSIKDSPLIKDHARRDFINAVNYPQNFFKHADRDPNTKMKFCPNGTQILLLDAVLLYVSLQAGLTLEMKVLLIWAQLRFPDVFQLASVEDSLSQIRNTTSDPKLFMALARVLLNGDSI